VIKYLGSKRVLLPRIVAAFAALPGVRRVADLFSGTARVGHALKRAGLEAHASDALRYAATLARCYVATDAGARLREATELVGHLAAVPPRDGWFTEIFCRRSRFFRPENGARIEGIREEIARLALPGDLEAVALVSLMEAADRVDSTTGVQMAYLKQWAPRAHNALALRVPAILPGRGHACEGEAAEIAAGLDVDAAYLDPPYNQHSYLGNYHVWETLCRWDEPQVYGVACKREDVRSRKSPFNSRATIREALEDVIGRLRCPWLVVSFSDEGYLEAGEIEALLAARGHVAVAEIPFRRYVGAKIGIYNPQGEKVGRISHLANRERLFVCGPEREAVRAAAEAARVEAPPGPNAASAPVPLRTAANGQE
jgi:adenine-specific DNA-methyltransferase